MGLPCSRCGVWSATAERARKKGRARAGRGERGARHGSAGEGAGGVRSRPRAGVFAGEVFRRGRGAGFLHTTRSGGQGALGAPARWRDPERQGGARSKDRPVRPRPPEWTQPSFAPPRPRPQSRNPRDATPRTRGSAQDPARGGSPRLSPSPRAPATPRRCGQRAAPRKIGVGCGAEKGASDPFNASPAAAPASRGPETQESRRAQALGGWRGLSGLGGFRGSSRARGSRKLGGTQGVHGGRGTQRGPMGLAAEGVGEPPGPLRPRRLSALGGPSPRGLGPRPRHGTRPKSLPTPATGDMRRITLS